jgi:hypothetical protein
MYTNMQVCVYMDVYLSYMYKISNLFYLLSLIYDYLIDGLYVYLQVSGQDLVEHMLWVAAGYPLPKDLTDVTFLPATGWALESRYVCIWKYICMAVSI